MMESNSPLPFWDYCLERRDLLLNSAEEACDKTYV